MLASAQLAFGQPVLAVRSLDRAVALSKAESVLLAAARVYVDAETRRRRGRSRPISCAPRAGAQAYAKLIEGNAALKRGEPAVASGCCARRSMASNLDRKVRPGPRVSAGARVRRGARRARCLREAPGRGERAVHRRVPTTGTFPTRSTGSRSRRKASRVPLRRILSRLPGDQGEGGRAGSADRGRKGLERRRCTPLIRDGKPVDADYT